MRDLEALTVDSQILSLPRSEASPALSGAVVRSASPGPAGFELDSGDLLTIIAEFKSLFELKRH